MCHGDGLKYFESTCQFGPGLNNLRIACFKRVVVVICFYKLRFSRRPLSDHEKFKPMLRLKLVYGSNGTECYSTKNKTLQLREGSRDIEELDLRKEELSSGAVFAQDLAPLT